jgi:anthranilate synthase/aminodeoxychorismate synthase-like glutamine amidotransferase
MILVIDNYDSFTFNLVQYFGELGADVVVRRNDEIAVDDVATLAPSAIVISPGPCAPEQAGVSVPVIQRWGGTIPVLGVCLGHQAIAEAFGGRVVRAKRVMHGKVSTIEHDATGLFASVPQPATVMRYHSLVADPHALPDCLEVLARATDDRDEIHALRHRRFPVWGVQFHPESIMTPHGRTILRNFLELAQ